MTASVFTLFWSISWNGLYHIQPDSESRKDGCQTGLQHRLCTTVDSLDAQLREHGTFNSFLESACLYKQVFTVTSQHLQALQSMELQLLIAGEALHGCCDGLYASSLKHLM